MVLSIGKETQPMTYLSDAGRVVLSNAAQRDDLSVMPLPETLTFEDGALIDPASWEIPALFRILQASGGVAIEEMRQVFNLGVGLIVVLPPDQVTPVRAAATHAGPATWIMGEVRRGERAVRFAG